ncbi:cupin domain-containing protein [Brevibacillus fulvus]|uniref:Cupin superfamily sugar epimerase n=1 Tax=Brevibacillus fulvus TaxID=1125967 RepID=A0A939BQW8_9BACL|nr:cupin domain-containing protein [Brevibacillus fulvus]MBM7588843.1 putative cupin superfamily sugar epimerase [Brevibacillus fulvus]
MSQAEHSQAKTAEYWKKHLQLTAHEEGGYFRQIYRSSEQISDQELSVSFAGKRLLATSIYFLLPSDEVSHFHRLKSDELWYYHAGSSLTIYIIHEDGRLETVKLGLDIENGEVPQALAPKNSIFGSAVNQPDTYSLVGCMVSPGFEYEDFELFTRNELLEKYPAHEAIIKRLTPDE